MEDFQAAGLVRRCLAGDAVAWEELVRQYHRRVYNLCYRFTGSRADAEDLSQEVFIRMYRTLSSFEPGRGALATWITTLARNLLVDHFRKTRHERVTESLDAPPGTEEGAPSPGERLRDSGPPPDARVHGRELQEQVQRALGKLSPELREAVILRDLEDMDYRDIALVLKVPEGTVKSRINRGRRELGRLMPRIGRVG